jgi:hypothetical protein
MHPKSVSSSFLGAWSPTRVKMKTAGSTDKQIVGAKRRYELALMISSASLEAVLRTK